MVKMCFVSSCITFSCHVAMSVGDILSSALTSNTRKLGRQKSPRKGDDGIVLGQRRRQWANITPAFGRHLVVSGVVGHHFTLVFEGRICHFAEWEIRPFNTRVTTKDVREEHIVTAKGLNQQTLQQHLTETLKAPYCTRQHVLFEQH